MLLKIVTILSLLENHWDELNFTNPLENVTELIVLGERMSSVAVDKFGVDRKNV